METIIEEIRSEIEKLPPYEINSYPLNSYPYRLVILNRLYPDITTKTNELTPEQIKEKYEYTVRWINMHKINKDDIDRLGNHLVECHNIKDSDFILPAKINNYKKYVKYLKYGCVNALENPNITQIAKEHIKQRLSSITVVSNFT